MISGNNEISGYIKTQICKEYIGRNIYAMGLKGTYFENAKGQDK